MDPSSSGDVSKFSDGTIVRAPRVVRAGKRRPGRSGCMSILVDDSAELIVSVYYQVVDAVGFVRLGSGSQGCGSDE
jgi:hypothetical protein